MFTTNPTYSARSFSRFPTDTRSPLFWLPRKVASCPHTQSDLPRFSSDHFVTVETAGTSEVKSRGEMPAISIGSAKARTVPLGRGRCERVPSMPSFSRRRRTPHGGLGLTTRTTSLGDGASRAGSVAPASRCRASAAPSRPDTNVRLVRGRETNVSFCLRIAHTGGLAPVPQPVREYGGHPVRSRGIRRPVVTPNDQRIAAPGIIGAAVLEMRVTDATGARGPPQLGVALGSRLLRVFSAGLGHQV